MIAGIVPRATFSKNAPVQVQVEESSVHDGPLPDHWKEPNNWLLAVMFRILCLVALGRPNLELVWSYYRSEDRFMEGQMQMKEKVTTVTIVVREGYSLQCCHRADQKPDCVLYPSNAACRSHCCLVGL